MPQTPLQQFVDIYQALEKGNLDSLRAVYSSDVEFIDNQHHLHGIDPLIAYFETQYSNLLHCKFHIQETHQSGENAWLIWEMEFAHPKLRGGDTLLVPGASHLRVGQSVDYHRDYFDMGQVLYENLPLIGSVIRWIKHRAAQ